MKHIFRRLALAAGLLAGSLASTSVFAQTSPAGLGSLNAAGSFADSNTYPMCQLTDNCSSTSDPLVAGSIGQLASYLAGRTTLINGQQYAPPCPLTDAATIAVSALSCPANPLDGLYFQTVTLTGNRLLGNPTGLVAGQVINFIVTEDATGGRTLSVPATTVYHISNPSGQALQPGINLSPNAVSELSCLATGAASMNCVVIPNFVIPGFAIVHHTTFPTPTNGANTIVNTITVTAGDTLLVEGASGCSDSGCVNAKPTASAPTATGVGAIGTCVAAVGSNLTFRWTYYCPVTFTGSITLTEQLSTTNSYYATMASQDVSGIAASPDELVGATGSGTGTAVSFATSGSVPQPVSFLVALVGYPGGSTIAAGSGWNTIDNDATDGFMVEYEVTSATGTQNATATLAPSGAWTGFVAAFQ